MPSVGFASRWGDGMDAHTRLQAQIREIAIDLLPELEPQIGMVGSMTQAEVGGQVCIEVGILIATVSHGMIV